MLLDDRKLKILQAIIDDYIYSAEPVGSRTIAKKHELGLSSATIRNEMADLEEMGLLEQPYTSAGRIPSDRGYRLYVDQLMKIDELNECEIEKIRSDMNIRINELSQLIRSASAVMAKITKYTSMAVSPHMKKSVLKSVQVVPIESGKALVIIVTDANIVRNNLIRIPESVTPAFLIQISNMLNEQLKGFTLEMLKSDILNEKFEKLTALPFRLIKPILDGIEELIITIDNPEVYLEGATNILNFPEFKEVDKAKEFLNILDEKKLVSDLLTNSVNDNNEIIIHIGNENAMEGIKDCSLVTASYSVGNHVIGTIGIIGPTRMEYSRVVSSMNYIRNKINQEILKLLDNG
ncbi:heat-inducible transcriptional repressor HrcA [Ruminiclostridium cellulolyticum]|uniref:Heat-inducible transcription repressor HrcA n=1 Tax=Ruminiclostridium cellulolyticum (strain ATCC 35319 / DSM 5812 / JCM 6584 / H10) TaxID=394503 RepID=HRCA_RUMCH|nr:heat-inducible transcriptional repressor HrcA [Ruminiclostridium cellulolyticum]B8I307.1 RecName: Full=Heat-inducible transcription repressor HrcA [Ruminiclostridium cellulolyticum H10]ACL76150.1 heat-inducible transcription repressor HrcA [Ruminiclostridium cellulolyticum H10]